MIDGQGCFDINECLESDESCPGNQFCVNKEGSFLCLGRLMNLRKILRC